MQVQLAHGTWAVAQRDGVRVGVLDGGVEHGWHTTVADLPLHVLPALTARLNLGGVWGHEQLSVRVDDECARLDLNGRHVQLGPEPTARLQILCRLAGAGARSIPSTPRLVVDVHADPGALTTEPVQIDGDVHSLGPVTAAPGGVVLHLTTSTGPIDVQIPALAGLVAALEADRSARPATITLRRAGRDPHVMRVPARELARASAEGQWLLPSLTRPVDTQA